MSARRSLTQPLPMELVGPLDSAEIQNYNKLLRLYRNRYSPLIRLSTTLLSWDNAKLRNNTNNNINNTNSEDAQYRQNPFCTPVPTLSVKRSIAVIDDQKQQNAEATLQRFLQYRLLSYILLHNLIPEDTTLLKNTAERLLIRHYAHESGKTNSFLIADLVLKKTILIDPHHGFISPDGNHRNVNNYCKDLDKFDLTLEYIFVTHAFLDLQLGVTDVLAAYQHQNKKDNVVKVVSGLSPNKEINAGHTETYALGDFITVRTNAVPSFSRENIVVELYLSLPDSNAETLVALFAGTAWSVDSPPRGDVLDSYDAVLRLATQQAGDLPSVTELCQNDDLKFFASRGAMQTARENLYQFFVKRYGLDDQSHTNKHNSVVLFPSHGGYSNMSNQLDMYLGIYLSDLMKFAQCRKVIDCVVGDGNGGAAAYITYSRMMPPMPQWITYQTNRIAKSTTITKYPTCRE
ncbi:hypothetical protein AGDE_11699 [Angomonas deanei]|uniref:Uncharacterized protein n=1 Tax=Angomonas deanei TaxID=59799 RepID=A0A7G2C7H5_9TRYP|nr:hypothetical protein AGDE_11699 [Angomonas deanei]CAD2215706.1 hypothetical protein, conserved [Angomonas deanei]|eukprot:EPY25784.1 hypothetical protein AGDE_11699 [Angomonas deanei]